MILMIMIMIIIIMIIIIIIIITIVKMIITQCPQLGGERVVRIILGATIIRKSSIITIITMIKVS